MCEIYCCVTIDTEPDCDIHWRRSNPLTFSSVLYGIPELLRPIWNRYGIKPTYFVSPEVIMNVECCEVFKKEIELGSEVGAHLHSEYIEPEKKYNSVSGTISDEFPCFAHDSKTEFEKIKTLTYLIESKVGIKPISYRAGRYGADLDTINSLIKLEYRIDSSITPHINWSNKGGPDHSRGLEQPYWVSQKDYYKENKANKKILEVPITIGNKRFGYFGKYLPDSGLFYNWLRPTHMTVFEMKKLIKNYIEKYKNEEVVVLNMMFHSMEIIPKATPYVRGGIDQKLFLKRLEKVLNWLKCIETTQVTLKDLWERFK